MSEGRFLLALYLTKDPAVERAIADNGWVTEPLVVDSVRSF